MRCAAGSVGARKSVELQGACRCKRANSTLLVIKGSFSEEHRELESSRTLRNLLPCQVVAKALPH